MKKLLLATAVAGLFGLAPVAQAGPVTVYENSFLDGTASAGIETQLMGKPGYMPTNGGTSADGYHNGKVELDKGRYVLEYWGSGNATFDNTFTLNAGAYNIISGPAAGIFSDGPGGTGSGSVFTPYVIEVLSDNVLLDFTYSTNSGTAGVGDDCSSKPDSAVTNTCDFIAGVDGIVVNNPNALLADSTTGNVGYLGFSDREEGIDTDHQDLTIRISAVPEPGSLALVGLALTGLALRRRRA